MQYGSNHSIPESLVNMMLLNRDGRESFVVTKVFDVERLDSGVSATAEDDLDFIREIPVAEVGLNLNTICADS